MRMLNYEDILGTLRSGDREALLAMIANFPESERHEINVGLMYSDDPALCAMSLGPLTWRYGKRSAGCLGVHLAEAAHTFARETFERQGPESALLVQTLAQFAYHLCRALNERNEYEKTLDFCSRVIPYYTALGEDEFLPKIRLERMEARQACEVYHMVCKQLVHATDEQAVSNDGRIKDVTGFLSEKKLKQWLIHCRN